MKWLPGGMDPYVCILVTLLVGACVGVFNGLMVAKVGVNSFLQTLASNIIIRGLVLFMLPFSLSRLNHVYTFAGSGFIFGIQAAIPIVLSVFIIFQLIMKYTSFGRQVISTGGNPQASYIAGINTSRLLVIVFALSGMLAAMAGLLSAGRSGAVANSMGTGMNMMAIAGGILGGASLTGGKGMPIGMLGGAILLQMISNSLTLLGVPINLVYASKGALIFLALLLDRYKVYLRNSILEKKQMEQHLTADAVKSASVNPSS